MSQLDDISYVDTLQVQTASGETAPIIYANGRHQVPIQVIVKAITKDDKPVTSVDELSKGLFLCFADNGNKLNWKGETGWTYTDEQGEYNGEAQSLSSIVGPTSASVGDDGTAIFKYFVSSTNVEIRRISVSLKTSTKLFTTADNASGAEKSSVRIEARPAIHYGDRNNLEIKLGGFETLESDLLWYSDYDTDAEKHHQNGFSRRRIAYIHPASQTGQTKFKNHEINYAPVQMEDLYIDDKVHYSIELFQGDSRPCAVIGRSQANENYQILLAYSRQNFVQLNGHADLVNNSGSRYNVKVPIVTDQNFGVDEHGIPSFLLYQFSYPIGAKVTQYKWKNAVHRPTLKLTDFYGNEGSVDLVFNDDTSFDGPGIM